MTISINSDFYNLKAVKRTVLIFEKEDIGTFSVEDSNGEIKVKIKGIDQNIKEDIKDEFLNYVLAETINEMKQSNMS